MVQVLGSDLAPIGTKDYAVLLDKALKSGADSLAMIVVGGDVVTSLKQGADIGLPQKMRVMGTMLMDETLGQAGATIIAQENTRLWLTTDVTWPWSHETVQPLPKGARPNKTFYSRGELALVGKQIEYGHLRDCPHTDGDMYVFLRDANVLAVGGALSCVVGERGENWVLRVEEVGAYMAYLAVAGEEADNDGDDDGGVLENARIRRRGKEILDEL